MSDSYYLGWLISVALVFGFGLGILLPAFLGYWVRRTSERWLELRRAKLDLRKAELVVYEKQCELRRAEFLLAKEKAAQELAHQKAQAVLENERLKEQQAYEQDAKRNIARFQHDLNSAIAMERVRLEEQFLSKNSGFSTAWDHQCIPPAYVIRFRAPGYRDEENLFPNQAGVIPAQWEERSRTTMMARYTTWKRAQS